MEKSDGSESASFTTELSTCWQALPDKGMFFGLLAAWLALFHFFGNSTFGYVDTRSLFFWLRNAAQGNQEEHTMLVPFVVIALFWWKRKELLAIPAHTWGPGILMVGSALVLHLGAYLIQQPKISLVAFY